jgi:cell wall-associated NlpC family hydrolase
MRRLYIILISTAFLLLGGCSSTPSQYGASATAPSRDRAQVVQTALNQVGRPYRYGGNTPGSGFDCSGLVYYSHQSAGIAVPRSSKLQLRQIRRVRYSEIKPGDLLFYKISNKPSHVAIYIGNGKFVHAPSSGKKVAIDHIESQYWRKRLYSTGTFLH